MLDAISGVSHLAMTFSKRPSPMPAEFRFLWRLGALSLILATGSRRATSSLPRYHMLAWALHSKERQDQLASVLNDGDARMPLLRYEPAWTRTIAYAYAEQLIELKTLASGDVRIMLAERGSALAQRLLAADSMMEERSFLTGIRSAASESRIAALFAREATL
jgi:hypothetical protein